MSQTTETTVQYSLPTEQIVKAVLAEARPFNVCGPLVLNEIQPAGQGKVWKKNIPATTTSPAIHAHAEIETIGLSTELTKLAENSSRLASQIILWAESQGRAIAQRITRQICALFLDLGSAVGHRWGANITVADFIEAIQVLDRTGATGLRRCVLHPRQVAQLFTNLTGTGAICQNLPELVRAGMLPESQPSAGFVGMLFGVPIYQTSEVKLINDNEDRCGAMFVPEAMAFVQQKPITVEYDYDALKRAREIVVTAAYGVCEYIGAYGVQIVTGA